MSGIMKFLCRTHKHWRILVDIVMTHACLPEERLDQQVFRWTGWNHRKLGIPIWLHRKIHYRLRVCMWNVEWFFIKKKKKSPVFWNFILSQYHKRQFTYRRLSPNPLNQHPKTFQRDWRGLQTNTTLMSLKMLLQTKLTLILQITTRWANDSCSHKIWACWISADHQCLFIYVLYWSLLLCDLE